MCRSFWEKKSQQSKVGTTKKSEPPKKYAQSSQSSSSSSSSSSESSMAARLDSKSIIFPIKPSGFLSSFLTCSTFFSLAPILIELRSPSLASNSLGGFSTCAASLYALLTAAPAPAVLPAPEPRRAGPAPSLRRPLQFVRRPLQRPLRRPPRRTRNN